MLKQISSKNSTRKKTRLKIFSQHHIIIYHMLKHETWFVQKLNMTFYDILTFRRRRHGFDLQCQASASSKGVSQVFWEEKHWQKSRTTTMRSSKRHDNLLSRSLTGKLVADGVNVIPVGLEHVGGPPFKVGRNIHLKNHLWKSTRAFGLEKSIFLSYYTMSSNL